MLGRNVTAQSALRLNQPRYSDMTCALLTSVNELFDLVMIFEESLLIQARQNSFNLTWTRLREDLLVRGADTDRDQTKKLSIRLRSCMVVLTRAAPHVRSPILLTLGNHWSTSCSDPARRFTTVCVFMGLALRQAKMCLKAA